MPRRVRRAAAFAIAVPSLSLLTSAQTAKTPLRPSDLLDSPQQFANHKVEYLGRGTLAPAPSK